MSNEDLVNGSVPNFGYQVRRQPICINVPADLQADVV